MKKYLPIVYGLVMFSFTSSYGQIRFAPEIGTKQTFTNYYHGEDEVYVPFGSTLISTNDAWAPHIGLNISVPLYRNKWSLTSGVFYNTSSTSYIKYRFNNLFDYHYLDMIHFSVPLNVNLNIPLKTHEFFIAAGPYINTIVYATGIEFQRGGGHHNDSSEQRKFSIGSKSDGAEIKRLDGGINLNFGFGHRSGLRFKINYRESFTNKNKYATGEKMIFASNSLAFALAYQF